jgi:acetate kinase
MRILVINAGSSSVKYRLFDMRHQRVLAHGLLEKIGEKGARLYHYTAAGEGSAATEQEERVPLADHRRGLERIAELLLAGIPGVAAGAGIAAVGHRVVHGGETFQHPVSIDEEVLEAIRANTVLAPLHNPPNLVGIEVARTVFPNAVQVAVFDTAFHQTMPPEAYLYALPYALYRKNRVRRYGFHGTSHAYVAQAAARYLDSDPDAVNLISIHLGNGASMAAIRGGRCVDTTMGMTPLEGLVMGTRAGDIDPALPIHFARQLGMSLEEIDGLLNRRSGLKGLCGVNDMREIVRRRQKGDRQAGLAFALYTYRIKKYIGAFMAVVGHVDAIVFTAGIGENAAEVRWESTRNLEHLGIRMDGERNREPSSDIRRVSHDASRTAVLVVPTNEELQIAREVYHLVAPAREKAVNREGNQKP